MTEISASLVKELREKSGAGMMECKKALVENKGDMDAAKKASHPLARRLVALRLKASSASQLRAQLRLLSS